MRVCSLFSYIWPDFSLDFSFGRGGGEDIVSGLQHWLEGDFEARIALQTTFEPLWHFTNEIQFSDIFLNLFVVNWCSFIYLFVYFVKIFWWQIITLGRTSSGLEIGTSARWGVERIGWFSVDAMPPPPTTTTITPRKNLYELQNLNAKLKGVPRP